MNKVIKNITFFGLFLLITSQVVAQEEIENKKDSDTISTESVIVVKTFNPTINDAFKIKATPSFDEQSVKVKETSNYKINSVPVASTFVPQKTKSVEVKKEKPISQFNNYAKLAIGNFVNINAEAFSTFEIDRDSQFSVLLEHLSTQGGISGIELDDKYYDTGIQLTYDRQSRNLNWSADFELQHQLYNWYGLPDGLTTPINDIVGLDVAHNYIDVNVGAQFYLDNEFFKFAKIKFRHFRDDFDSAENNVTIKSEFSIPLEEITIKLPVELDFVSGEFEDNVFFTPEKYSILNLGVSPSVAINLQGADVQIGISGYISSDSENSDTDFFVYPNITANYEIPEYNVSVFGGIKGGLIQNTYYNAIEENKFAAPELALTPTSQSFNIFAGAKGNLQGNFGYEATASFRVEKDKPLWVKTAEVIGTDVIPFGLSNSFVYVYDDVNIGQLDLKLNYDVENSFGISLSTLFTTYGLDDQDEAWNLPNFEANLQANYIFTEQVKLTAGLFFKGSRKDIDQVTLTTVDVDGYFDANFQLDYKINKQWQAFLKGNNLTSQNYELWQDFEVQSIQFLVGAKYLF